MKKLTIGVLAIIGAGAVVAVIHDHFVANPKN